MLKLLEVYHHRSKRETLQPNLDLPTQIRTHLSQRQPKQALLLFTQLLRQGLSTSNLLPPILKACASLPSPNLAKSIHALALKSGTLLNVFVATSLLSTYSKFNDVIDARKVFDEMRVRNAVSWNAMIGGYWRNGDPHSALGLFRSMSMPRTCVTWVEMITGFARIRETGNARKFFDRVPLEMKNVVTWTVMVEGYCLNGEMEKAREVFEAMPEKGFFVWSSMVSGYCKTGDVEEARRVFDRIPVRNLVNWNSMIGGYAQNGFCEEALKLFEDMKGEGFEPDEFTVVSVLSACSQSGLLDVGKGVHDMVGRNGIRLNQIVQNALVDMYAKCGDLVNARLIFEELSERNSACWNAMISSMAALGQCKDALQLFSRMEGSSEKPDEITFLAVLSACAHGGLVDEGMEIFSKMRRKYDLEAGVRHYGCLVDLLGRDGRLREAYSLVKSMPIKPNDMVWGAMLGACRIYMDMEMTELVAEDISTLNSSMLSTDDSHFVLLSNIYAASDKWEKAERTRIDLVNKGFENIRAHSAFVSCGT